MKFFIDANHGNASLEVYALFILLPGLCAVCSGSVRSRVLKMDEMNLICKFVFYFDMSWEFCVAGTCGFLYPLF